MDGIGSSSGPVGPQRTPQVRKELLEQLPESTRVALPKLGPEKIISLRRYFGKILGDIAHLREGPSFPRASFVDKKTHGELYYQALKDVQMEERQWNWRTTPKVPCEAPEPIYQIKYGGGGMYPKPSDPPEPIFQIKYGGGGMYPKPSDPPEPIFQIKYGGGGMYPKPSDPPDPVFQIKYGGGGVHPKPDPPDPVFQIKYGGGGLNQD